MAMTLDDLLDTVLARHCSECGEELPRRGDQCPACETLPEETRAEAEERLRTDTAAFAEAERKVVLEAAAAEAARFREEAEDHRRQMREAFAAADRAVFVAQLQVAAAAAGRELDAAREAEKQAGAALAGAVEAERESAAELADAAQVHRKAAQAEEAVRRLRKGAQAETDAQLRLDAAAKVLGRHQADHGAMAAARDQAQRHVVGASALAAERQAVAGRFAYAAEHTTRAPMSKEAVFADVFGLAARAGVGQLDAEDKLMVMGAVQMMVISLGLEELIRSDEEGRVRARDAAEEKRRPQFAPGANGWAVSMPAPSGPLPDDGTTTPPPAFGYPSPSAAAFGPMSSVSPGIPGAPPPTLAKAARPSGHGYEDGLWGISQLYNGIRLSGG